MGETKELWMQISWVNTDPLEAEVTLRGLVSGEDESGVIVIVWAEDATGCPADTSDPLPSTDGTGLLINEGTFTPLGTSVPSDLLFTDGYERSFSFPDANATCARITTAFDIPDGGDLNIR